MADLSAVPPRPAHAAHLDGLRALLALYVVVHHSYLTIWAPGYGGHPSPRAAVVAGWMSHGNVAVAGFIVLSGYVLMSAVAAHGGRLRGGPWHFLRRRARRILPPFYAAIAFCLLMILTVVGRRTGTHWDVALPPTGLAVVANLFMLQDVVAQGRINHVFWSIAVESRIYLLFPLIVPLFARLGAAPAGGLLATAAVALAFACRPLGVEQFQQNFSYLAIFVLGGVAAVRSPWRSWIVAPAVAFTAVVAAQQGGYLASPLMRQPLQDLALGLTFAAWLAYWSTPSATVARAALGWGPLAAVGVFAYSLYLTHAPVVQLAWQLAVRPLGLTDVRGLAVLLAVAGPATLLAAYGFFLVAERPFLSARQRAAATQELAPPPPAAP